MCGKLNNGTEAIIDCYKRCDTSSSFRDNLRSEYNSSLQNNTSQSTNQTYEAPVQMISQPAVGKCGPNGIDTGSSCTPKSIYCNSIACKTTGCPQCEGYQGEAAKGKVDCNDPEMQASADCTGAGAGTRAQGSDTAAAGDNCVLPLFHRDSEGKCRDGNNKLVDENAIGEEVATDSKKDPESGMSCIQAKEETLSACDSDSKSWMSGINDVVATLGPAVNQIDSSTCGGIAAAQSGAAASLATFQSMCNSAMKKCTQACTGSTIPSDVSALATCKKMGVSAAEANKSAASAMMTLKGSVTQCQNAFGDMSQQATAYCASNPASCANKPMVNAQSLAPQGDQAGGTPVPNLGTEGVGGLTGKGSGGLNIGDLGDDSGGGIGTINPSKPGEDPGGNKGGGHVGSSGGGQGDAGGGRGGGGKREGLISNILSGFFGSGGSGGGSGGGFFSKLFGGGNKSDAYAANNPNLKKVGPDLRQFLPGGLHDPNRNRGIAGQFIGQDGMAGPHSDIWKNINNRYQFKRASLVP